MEEIKVSVIIPVYNVEKYLDKCIESILNQTLKEIEVILINDGSKDRSNFICKKYEKRDKRIKYINKSNEGCSKARNIGIILAQGKYIAFVDPDDFIEKNMYEIMYNISEKSFLDILICGIKRLDENYQVIKEKIPEKYLNKMDYYNSKNDCFNSPCNKLYKREFILKNNIFFPINTHMGEDLVFNVKAFYFTNKIGIVKKCLYNYYKNILSVTNNFNKQFEIYKSLEEIFNFFLKFETKQYLKIFNYFLLRSGICNMYGLIENMRIEKNKNWKKALNLVEKNIEKFESDFNFKQRIYIFYRKKRINLYFLKPIVKNLKRIK